MLKPGACLLFLLIAALGACRREDDAEAAAPPSPPPQPVAHCEPRLFEGDAFTACFYDPRRHRLEIVVGDEAGPYRRFSALEQSLGARRDTLLFAMNGGMFDEQGHPIGLHVERGEEKRAINRRGGSGNFHLMPNGVLMVDKDGRARVMTSEDYAARNLKPVWATQSGPMLVVGGELHPKFEPNGESRHVRNGVGDSAHGGAWLAISETPVSFGRFARFFRDELGSRNALYLDGSVSSLWDAGDGRMDERRSLGPMILVFRRHPVPTDEKGQGQ